MSAVLAFFRPDWNVFILRQNRLQENVGKCTASDKGKKKVNTSIYIARFMHQAPLTRTSLKLGRQTAILGHRQACKHSPDSDPITGTGRSIQGNDIIDHCDLSMSTLN